MLGCAGQFCSSVSSVQSILLSQRSSIGMQRVTSHGNSFSKQSVDGMKRAIRMVVQGEISCIDYRVFK